ncbi:MAG: M1 family metallopeptidase [Pyrinomonadaceae bacterium]
MNTKFLNAAIIIFLILLTGVSKNAVGQNMKPVDKQKKPAAAQDFHSYSNPGEIRVTHVDLDWDVLFDKKVISGTATLQFERKTDDPNALLNLDTRDLTIEKVEASEDGGKSFSPVKFRLGETDKFLGAPLVIGLSAKADRVRITYATSPDASGLQWLTPEQTAGKKTPYMFSQAQAIHARSFIPLQDSPQVRVTYTAKVRTPKGLLAVMSAEGNLQDNDRRDGRYAFKMTHPIPPYLIAVAVGDLEFRPLGKRTGIYTEPEMIEKAAYELADTEKMVEETEKIYGPYRWDRYDLLVLPPSFPFGGMENPMLTFATPTILAGDRSLVSLVAHELAHSWSGNLVTNATWRDFWLNEGFTTYLERRIIEAVYGVPRREMEATLGRRSLEEELSDLDERDEILHVDLRGRDPDEGFTGVPYEKGALFLRHLEEEVGRPKFDKFVRGYFDHFAFQSITTETFVDYLQKNLIDKNPKMVSRADVDQWIEKPGLPDDAPRPASDAFQKVEAQERNWLEGRSAAGDLKTSGWTTQEWLHFLKTMPEDLSAEKMAELDGAFHLTGVGNSEIAYQWLMMSIRRDYRPAYPRLEEFLTTIGRRKFVKPLFEELAKTPEGLERARQIYKKARPGYHPITIASVDAVLKWEER